MNTNRIVEHDEHGHIVPIIKKHSLQKLSHIAYYAKVFASATRQVFSNRVFIDLFAGAGIAKLAGTNDIVDTSSLIAMNVDHPFDKYILCELSHESIVALKHRVAARHPELDVIYIEGDTNQNVDAILSEMPAFGKGNLLLSLCLVDPFNAGNLQFKTIQTLVAKYRMDLIVLIPTGMDGQRNEAKFLKSEETKSLDTFLNGRGWRKRRLSERGSRIPFSSFILNEFNTLMAAEGFLISEAQETKNVIFARNNRGLYLVAMYSKHKLAKKIWADAIKNLRKQQELF